MALGFIILKVFSINFSEKSSIDPSIKVKDDLSIRLTDITGRVVKEATINKGSTIAYFDVQTVYEGTYIVHIANGQNVTTEKIIILRD